MRLLLIHADAFEYSVREPAVEKPEAIEEDRKSLAVENSLVVFTTVEKEDEDKIEDVVSEAIDAILEVFSKVSPESIVIYPYAHLSSELARPEVALQVLKKLEEKLKEKDVKVYRAPFGWYKSFMIRCKGHPLSELSRYITGKAKRKEGKEEKKPSEYLIIDPNGNVHKVILKEEEIKKLSILEEYPLLKQYILSEELGKKPHRTPEHIRLMRRLELVDYEPASDSGHFRFYPKGELIKNLLENFADKIAVEELHAMKIETPMMYKLDEPDIAKQAARFRERDYRLRVGNRELLLRFAGDFGLFRMMKDIIMTYKQLPIRIYELVKAFRLEQSGELVGLRRLRAFTMPDIHSFCRDIKQGMEEYEVLFEYYTKLLNTLRLPYVLVFRIVKDFYYENEEWVHNLIKKAKVPAFIELLPERKHYWIIKHEYQYIDSVGGNAQLCTVQLDIEDAERYGIYFIDENNERRPCIIIHSSMGSIERWIYALLEEAAKRIKEGKVPKLPTWLSPIQVRVIPVSSEYLKHAIEIATKINNEGFRCDVDDRDETVSAKIRDAEKEWIPYIIVIGKREVERKRLSVRIRGNGIVELDMSELIKRLEEECKGMPKLPLYTPLLLSKRPRFT